MPPPSAEVHRQRLNSRRIEIDGYRRDDGLYEIEGTLLDTRTADYRTTWRPTLPAGAPLHAMRARLVIDGNYMIRDLTVSTSAAPYPGSCESVAPVFHSLVGQSILENWQRTLHATAGGPRGCIHLVELLGRMGMTALQTVYLSEIPSEGLAPPPPRPEQKLFVDSCFSLRRNGPVMQQDFAHALVDLPKPQLEHPSTLNPPSDA